MESGEPLAPLDLLIDAPGSQVRLQGNCLSLTQHVESLRELTRLVEGIYYAFPPLLNVVFADPVVVERVAGTIGTTPFMWILSHWGMPFHLTDQQRQESAAGEAWRRLTLVGRPEHHRLLAGLHYFHTACRLARRGATPGEFVSEVILNLAKTLEVLFPPVRGVQKRDAVRGSLLELGFKAEAIESDFLPVIALRNEIDVGHVHLGLFSRDQLNVIHAYTERAEEAFRLLLERLLSGIEAGTYEVAVYRATRARPEAIAVVERLRKRTPPTSG